MSDLASNSLHASRRHPMADAAARAMFEAAARVTRHHLGKLDARFRREQDQEEITDSGWNSDSTLTPDDAGH